MITRNTVLAMMKPIGAPSCGNVPYQARLPFGAFSVATSAAPDHSPPRAKPWNRRSSSSRNAAHQPMSLYVGRHPIRNVAIPIVSRDATRVALRPKRSPKCPKITAPMGRATIAAPNTANDESSEVVSLPVGKKRIGKTRTAAVA